MDYSKQRSVKESLSLFLLLLFCLNGQRSICAWAAPEDEYPMLLENQGFQDVATDSRSNLISSLNHLLEQNEEDKRSSSFFPLRGKKMSNSDRDMIDHYQLISDPEGKRSQFFPLRGKKVPSDLKRASYFMPMRGRKNDEFDLSSDDEDNVDKRASSFMPMRGKKKNDGVSNTFQLFEKPGTYSNIKPEITFPSINSNHRNQVKRMASLMPIHDEMSNRAEYQTEKELNFDSNELLSEDKNRVNSGHSQLKRSISFMPMRGRRLLSDSEMEDSEIEIPRSVVTSLLEKRGHSSLPMRVRRTSYFALKRPMSFFATRGKRLDDSSIEQISQLP